MPVHEDPGIVAVRTGRGVVSRRLRILTAGLLMLQCLACSVPEPGLECGQPVTVPVISTLISQHRQTAAEDVADAMRACPRDPVLARLLYSAYMGRGDCQQALRIHDDFAQVPGHFVFPALDLDDVLLCFHGTGQPRQAIAFHETRIAAAGVAASRMARQTYAHSLFVVGELAAAVEVLTNIEREGHPGPSQPLAAASHEQSVLLLSQVLFASADPLAAAAAARRFLALRPDSPEGYEVLLAAVVEAGGIDGIDPHALYCDARRLRLEVFSDEPESVQRDLALLKDRLLAESGAIACEGPAGGQDPADG